MLDALASDPYWEKLIEGYIDAEIAELQEYLLEWEAGTYDSVVHSVINHAERKQFDRLTYLRKASSFRKKGAKRVPKLGCRPDGTAVYRKDNEFLIMRLDRYGIERIVTYGINED
jgi:hypothetical protein